LPTTPGVVQPGYAGGGCLGTVLHPESPCTDAFIGKFDSSGALVFLTYLGGTGNDVPDGLAVDAAGNIYIGGQTTSTDFPLAGTPWRPTLTNPGTFLTKLSGDGKRLIWSTVLNSNLVQLALASDGSVYLLTRTFVESTTVGTFTAALTKLTQDGQFVATANVASGTQALAVGADGSVYIGGSTDGSDVTSTTGAWQTVFSGLGGFIAKLNPNLAGFAWLTFADAVTLIQPAPDGTLWAAGTTLDSSFPVLAGALQSQPSPGTSAVLVHLSGDGSKALAATYLAASITAMALDGSGNVIFNSFPNLSAFQATPGSQWPCPQGDSTFFGKIDAAGQHLLWGTWAGPSVPSGPVTVDKNGNAIAAGNIPGQADITLVDMTTVPGPPRLVETCIAQAGYPDISGPLAPGEIISIYGSGFGPEQGVLAQPSGNRVGTELAGVQVLIEGTPVPLLYVSSAQINLVAPYLLDGRTAAHVQIVTANATSNQVVLGVRPSAPEIFLNPAFSSNQSEPSTAAILNQDGTVNDPNHPAHMGDTVAMFVSGVGQINPAGEDGEIPQAAGGTPVLPITVQLSNPSPLPDVTVSYAGNAPGFVAGAVQVNFQIPRINPSGAPPYPAWVVLDVGGTTSPNGRPFGPVVWFEQ